MEITKKYKVLLVLALVALAGGFFFFYRMYQHDVMALRDFSASYGKFDKAISDFSANGTASSESEAKTAFAELNQSASVRISSLIKNDGELISTMQEIADLSGQELDALRAYKRAIQSKNANVDELAKEYGDLTSKRKAAYARFQELAGLKD